MAKKFHITGVCIPERHYMADVSEKVTAIMAMIEDGEYFVINRPRQYGKTTILYLLMLKLMEHTDYIPLRISFEGVGDLAYQSEQAFSEMFLNALAKAASFVDPDLADFLKMQSARVSNLEKLSATISELVIKSGLKCILLIDEVDKSSNNQLFVSFLAMLRNKYLDAQQKLDDTFHSIILTGVHDVKTLKLKLRPGEEAKLNSPWNIAADFKVEMSLLPGEMSSMLEEYATERGVALDADTIAERLFYYTSGYPFLVSKLCKTIDEDLLPSKELKVWAMEDLEKAVQRLLGESNANFDSLIKNLENNPDLYDLVYRVLVQGERLQYNAHDPMVVLGTLYGIFRKPGHDSNGLSVHNHIYGTVIANYMTFKTTRENKMIPVLTAEPFLLPGRGLNMKKLLCKFQSFMKEQYSQKDREFLERHGRLVFLAFLKPILNGAGYDFKEPQISEERRLDVVVTFYHHKYLVELKIWRGEAAHQRGLAQLADYLDRQQMDEGYLLIFDNSKSKEWKDEQLEVDGKHIIAVWV